MKTIQQCRLVRSIAIASLITAGSAQAAGPDLLSRELCKAAQPYAATAFSGVLAPVQQDGYCIAGDFNGDGKPDVLMVVKVAVAKVPATVGIRTIYPFFNKRDTGDKGRRRFLALHSTPGSEKAEWAQYDKLLLEGSSPIMVLRYDNMGSDMERVTQHSSAVRELKAPRRQMRGEGVSLGTEAVLAILYWNGKTYVFHEDPSGP